MKTSKEKIEEESRSRGFFRPDEVVESIVVTKVITAEKEREPLDIHLPNSVYLP
jgi:hypothetical protein